LNVFNIAKIVNDSYSKTPFRRFRPAGPKKQHAGLYWGVNNCYYFVYFLTEIVEKEVFYTSPSVDNLDLCM